MPKKKKEKKTEETFSLPQQSVLFMARIYLGLIRDRQAMQEKASLETKKLVETIQIAQYRLGEIESETLEKLNANDYNLGLIDNVVFEKTGKHLPEHFKNLNVQSDDLEFVYPDSCYLDSKPESERKQAPKTETGKSVPDNMTEQDVIEEEESTLDNLMEEEEQYDFEDESDESEYADDEEDSNEDSNTDQFDPANSDYGYAASEKKSVPDDKGLSDFLRDIRSRSKAFGPAPKKNYF